MKAISWIKQQKRTEVLLVALAVLALSGGLIYASIANTTPATTQTTSPVAANDHADEYVPPATPEQEIVNQTSTQAKESLLYLIEEEKLAHDVYLKMYEKYNARVFGNILKSEEKHQELVATVLDARNVTDPRSQEVGVFVNPDLQRLYDELVARGNQSLTEAYKVGVTIEEMDIADLKSDLAALDPAQTDVKSTLETLLKGSENHLRAFNRKLS